MLTQQQRDFCKYIALYEYSPQEAFYAAGYTVKQNRYIRDRILTLLQNTQISAEIDRLRARYLSPDEVRKDIVLEHQKTRDFDISSIMNIIPYTDSEGVQRYRLEIKPIADWSPIARQMLVGFDKNNIPIFKNKENATKEISRIYGLYKDNTVVNVQDFDSIYQDALGIDASNRGTDEDSIISVDTQMDIDEMESLDSMIMQELDNDEGNKEAKKQLEKEIEANPKDGNKIKLRSLLGK